MTNKVRAALDELPSYRASKAEWARRGYKVKRGQKNVQYIKVWNGMFYNKIKIYDIDQCQEIRGEKALQRRKDYDISLDMPF